VRGLLWYIMVLFYRQGSGMFVPTEDEDKGDGGVAKTSDPDKFVHLAIKSSDSLLGTLHYWLKLPKFYSLTFHCYNLL
jgi:hypothetical protein